MKSKILLSLCIPTNGVVEWVMPVIESIYSQRMDDALFEVVVTDNGETDDLEKAVKKLGKKNLHYYRTTSNGFTNQIDAFEKCNGEFCKMLNHRSKMIPGSMETIFGIVEKYLKEKPILYFAEGHAKGEEVIECANIDIFVKKLSFWISWSAGTGVWREDIQNIKGKLIDDLFPHTIFLFGLREDSRYVIWNGRYTQPINGAGKGGYDVFYAFAVRLVDLVSILRYRGKVNDDTYISFKKNLLSFLKDLYINEVILPTKHTFIIKDVCNSLTIHYGKHCYKMMVIQSWIKSIFRFFDLCYIKFKSLFLRDVKTS